MPEMLQISCDCPCYIGQSHRAFEGSYHMSFSKLPLVQVLCGIVSNNQLLVDDCLEKEGGGEGYGAYECPSRSWTMGSAVKLALMLMILDH